MLSIRLSVRRGASRLLHLPAAIVDPVRTVYLKRFFFFPQIRRTIQNGRPDHAHSLVQPSTTNSCTVSTCTQFVYEFSHGPAVTQTTRLTLSIVVPGRWINVNRTRRSYLFLSVYNTPVELLDSIHIARHTFCKNSLPNRAV